MRKTSVVLASTGMLALSGAALAQQAQAIDAAQAKAIMQKSDCATCHAIDKRVVGPAYQEVAQKYKGDSTAPEKLFAKVRAGGSGSFGLVGPHGEIRMPANPRDKISDADLKKLIAWILTL